jgi:hypothetical protein
VHGWLKAHAGDDLAQQYHMVLTRAGLAERKDWLVGPCVTHEWLKEVGITTLGHRMKVIALHAALLAGQGDF